MWLKGQVHTEFCHDKNCLWFYCAFGKPVFLVLAEPEILSSFDQELCLCFLLAVCACCCHPLVLDLQCHKSRVVPQQAHTTYLEKCCFCLFVFCFVIFLRTMQ